MFEEMTEQQAREQILEMTRNYCEKYHNKKKPYQKGDRIPYASRVYDAEEMVNLVDSSLEFWLTAGRYTDEFEHAFAKYLGVRYCSLVNSGSSANLLAFMTLTSPLLKERQILPGDEVITVAAGFPTTVSPMIQYGAVPVFVDVTISFTLFTPCLFRVSNVKSNTKTIAAVTSTIAITATVLFTNCFGVGQTTFFNSALKSFEKLFLFLLFSFLFVFASFLAILYPP